MTLPMALCVDVPLAISDLTNPEGARAGGSVDELPGYDIDGRDHGERDTYPRSRVAESTHDWIY